MSSDYLIWVLLVETPMLLILCWLAWKTTRGTDSDGEIQTRNGMEK